MKGQDERKRRGKGEGEEGEEGQEEKRTREGE